ncbi:MAG: hypothetical protein HQ581_24695 [Planctomycetes bacterium]|nr:hypothetical protein [Planctomycetota bacterium]
MRITGLLLICLMPVSAFAQSPERPRKLPITVSKETTRITEPLREDGSVDYIAALNQEASRGVTPENNANVLLWKAIGPKDIDEESRAAYFRALGMDPLPEQGDYFVSMNEFANTEKLDSFEDHQDAAMTGPWSKKQYPDVARWLRANRKPLELAVEAMRRPRYYSPLVATGEDFMLMAVMLPGISEYRGIGRALVARAMLQAKAGQIEAAHADLMACHRLARLVAQGPTLVDSLVGIGIEEMALFADAALAHFGNLTADQTRALQADLAALPALSPVVEKIDRGERYMFLDSVATIARLGPSSLSGLSLEVGGREKDATRRMMETMAANAVFDWNAILRMGNSYYDRLVDAMNRPTHAECAAAMDVISQEIASLAARAKDRKQLVWEVLKAGSVRQVASKYMGNIFLALLLPALDMVKIAEDRATTNLHLTRVAVLLSAHRTEKGAYPKKLAELAAGDDLLEDPYSGRPFGYRRQRGGFLLYSIGPNAIDNRGLDRRFDERLHADPDADDISLRMPPRKP